MRTLTFIIAVAALVGGCTMDFDGDDDNPPRGDRRPDAGYSVDGGTDPWPDAADGGTDPWPDAAPPDDGGCGGTPDAAPYYPDGDPDVDGGY